jgi:hypothetical protein
MYPEQHPQSPGERAVGGLAEGIGNLPYVAGAVVGWKAAKNHAQVNPNGWENAYAGVAVGSRAVMFILTNWVLICTWFGMVWLREQTPRTRFLEIMILVAFAVTGLASYNRIIDQGLFKRRLLYRLCSPFQRIVARWPEWLVMAFCFMPLVAHFIPALGVGIIIYAVLRLIPFKPGKSV